ncbi:hypothetical protein HanHA89_Chr16g0657651 [Helianthus annuus]|nr:hypothetical protein HanHA89_Chr16g0657651 [Helianthus annuus]
MKKQGVKGQMAWENSADASLTMNHQGRHFLYDNNEVELEKRRKRTSTAWVQLTSQ